MPVTRRQFIVLGQSLVAASLLPTRLLAASGTTNNNGQSLSLDTLSKADFLHSVNSSFAVRSSNVWLRLLSVEESTPKNSDTMALMPRPPKTPAPQVASFALHFQGTGEALTQGTYELEHHSLGKFSLFLVPSGKTTYMAVINHFVNFVPTSYPRAIRSKAQAATAAERESQ